MSKLKVVLVNILALGTLYGVLEVSYSTYSYFLRDSSPRSYSLFEHPGETVRFEPNMGFLLTETPSRVARITRGQVEFAGSFRGNAQGFADRDDFTTHRLIANQRRIGVLGDSFTAATMEPLNSPNWPDRVKDMDRAGNGQPLVLLNFSVDGVGLANWASILRNIIVKERYELDGLIFAVAWDDLDRKFAVFEQTDSKEFAYAQIPNWEVRSQPRTLLEARSLFKNHGMPNVYALSPTQFDAALSGQWKPRRWRFRISERLIGLADPLLQHFEMARKPLSGFEPGQLALMQEIRQLADENSLPLAVVYIPFREELLDPGYPSNVERTHQFSEILGARFIDGREGFRGLTSQQIKDNWFPWDGHWNHFGSDRFAGFMAAQIPNWVEASTAHAANMGAH
jgi:hypothetical protein